jgi:hypothetical protein
MMGVVFCEIWATLIPGQVIEGSVSAPAIIFYIKKRPRVEDSHSIFLGLGSRLDSALSCSPILGDMIGEKMEIYRNKLYCILDAAKRGGVNCDQILEMITFHVIMASEQNGVNFIWGQDIPGLKAKWEEWQTKKGKTKKADVTMLRMDKGE